MTKSPESFRRASATICAARSRSASSRARIERGVKPRCTIWRTLVCSGGSMFSMISFCTSIWSRVMDALKRMIEVLRFAEKMSGFVDTSLTS